MKVESVSYYNLDRLYAITAIRENDSMKEGSRAFLTNIASVYRKSKVTFELSEVTLLEVFLLKKFASSIIIKTGSTYNDFSEESLKSILFLLNNMEQDGDIKEKPSELFLAADMVEKRLLVTFTGHDLQSIITTTPNLFFGSLPNMSYTEDKTEKDPDGFVKVWKVVKRQEPELPNDEKSVELINDLLIRSFMEEFYKFCKKYLINSDICSDSINHGYYHKKVSNSTRVSCIEMTSPTGCLNLTISKDHVKKNLPSYKQGYGIVKDYVEDISTMDNEIQKSISLTVACHTSLGAFIYLFLAMPEGGITDHSQFAILLNPDNMIQLPDEWKDYNVRLTTKFEYLENRISAIKKTDTLKLFTKLPLYRAIDFTIQMSVYEINYLMNEIRNSVSQFANEDSFMRKEIDTILETLVSMANVAYITYVK